MPSSSVALKRSESLLYASGNGIFIIQINVSTEQKHKHQVQKVRVLIIYHLPLTITITFLTHIFQRLKAHQLIKMYTVISKKKNKNYPSIVDFVWSFQN